MSQHRVPSGPALEPPERSLRISTGKPTIEAYLNLYRAVGETLHWDERLRMPVAQAQALLEADRTSVHTLLDEGGACGFCEATRLPERRIEIAYFGLVPQVRGRGFGPYLLDAALRDIWAEEPALVRLRTDTNDHPAAVDTYRRAGFEILSREWTTFPD